MKKPQSADPNSVSQIAHKLRTPLTVITSTVENLLDGVFGKLNDAQIKWLKKLISHTANLEDLINKTLMILKKEPERAVEVLQAMENRFKLSSNYPAKPAGSLLSTVSPSKGEKVPTILIVDDEPDILDVIEEGLSTKGFNMRTASDGDKAFQIAMEIQPDLVLMDVLLKGQNGMEVCRKIKSHLPSYTPVILVTGQNDLRDKISGQEHQADDLLMKPFQMEELFSRVSSMLKIKKLHDQLEKLQKAAGDSTPKAQEG